MKSGEARGNQTEITKTLRGINGSGMKVGLRTWEQSDFQNPSPAPLLGRLEVYFRRGGVYVWGQLAQLRIGVLKLKQENSILNVEMARPLYNSDPRYRQEIRKVLPGETAHLIQKTYKYWHQGFPRDIVQSDHPTVKTTVDRVLSSTI